MLYISNHVPELNAGEYEIREVRPDQARKFWQGYDGRVSVAFGDPREAEKIGALLGKEIDASRLASYRPKSFTFAAGDRVLVLALDPHPLKRGTALEEYKITLISYQGLFFREFCDLCGYPDTRQCDECGGDLCETCADFERCDGCEALVCSECYTTEDGHHYCSPCLESRTG